MTIAALPEAPAAASVSPGKGSWVWLLNGRLAVGLTIVAIFTLAAFVLPFFAPADPALQSTYMKNMPLSWMHVLGTNSLGQDIFWLLVFAIRNSLILGGLVAVGVTIISTIVGLSAGFIGGNFERAVMLIVDTFITIPLLPLLIMLGALIRANNAFLVFAIIIFGWAWGARTVRSMTLSLREREFINMARFSGASTVDILAREVFPYITAYMLVNFINTMLFAINTEATLAVIGVSRVEIPTIGSIVFWALNYNALFTGNYVWIVAPIVASVILFLGLFLSSTGFNAAFANKRGVL